jgi:hypothetical protein
MAVQVQLRRGTEGQNNAFTGVVAELTVDTTNNELRVHDGSTAGGHVIGGGERELQAWRHDQRCANLRHGSCQRMGR